VENYRNKEWREDTQSLFNYFKEKLSDNKYFITLDGDSQYELFERLLSERPQNPENHVMRKILFGNEPLTQGQKAILKIGFTPTSNDFSQKEYYSEAEMRDFLQGEQHGQMNTSCGGGSKQRLVKKPRKKGRPKAAYDKVALESFVLSCIKDPDYIRANKPNVRAIARMAKKSEYLTGGKNCDRTLRELIGEIINRESLNSQRKSSKKKLDTSLLKKI
jgi:hypothetical protein